MTLLFKTLVKSQEQIFIYSTNQWSFSYPMKGKELFEKTFRFVVCITRNDFEHMEP